MAIFWKFVFMWLLGVCSGVALCWLILRTYFGRTPRSLIEDRRMVAKYRRYLSTGQR